MTTQPAPIASQSDLLDIRRPPRHETPPPRPLSDDAAGVAPPLNGAAGPIGAPPNTFEMHDAAPGDDESAAPPLPPIDENLLQQQAAINPLLGAAASILTLVCQLRGTLQHDNEQRLQWMVAEELKAFENRALLAEASPQDVIAARYVLCSLIDETVLATPWGNQGSWASQTMLSRFHRETWGGEKVFAILDRIKERPARYVNLIELIAICIALGFHGRYEVLENGLFRLEELRGELWKLVQAQRGAEELPLSPEFRVERIRRSLIRYVPLWIVFAIAGAVIVTTYAGLQLTLTHNLDSTATVLEQANPGR